MDHITNNLYIGNYQDTLDLENLKRNKIKFIVNCAAEHSNQFPGIFWYLNIPLEDPDPKIMRYKNMILGQIYPIYGEPTLFHCHAGISRSPTVATIFLSNYLGWPWQEVEALIKSQRPAVDINPTFKEILSRIL